MTTNVLFKEIEEEFLRHLTDCHDSKRAHFDLADYYYEQAARVHYIQSFGLSIIVAWLLSTQFDGLLPLEHPIVQVIPTVLAIIVSILTIAEHVFRFNDKACTHEQAAKRYHNLWRLCKNWKTDFPSEEYSEQARIAVQKYRDQLSDINREKAYPSPSGGTKCGDGGGLAA